MPSPRVIDLTNPVSPPSPPRPTIAHVSIQPRRRLRDGSVATTVSDNSSASSFQVDFESESKSSISARSTRSSRSSSSGLQGLAPRRLTRSDSVAGAASLSNSVNSQPPRPLSSGSNSPLALRPPTLFSGPGPGRRVGNQSPRRNRQNRHPVVEVDDDEDQIGHLDDNTSSRPALPRQSTPLNAVASSSGSGTASGSASGPRHPHANALALDIGSSPEQNPHIKPKNKRKKQVKRPTQSSSPIDVDEDEVQVEILDHNHKSREIAKKNEEDENVNDNDNEMPPKKKSKVDKGKGKENAIATINGKGKATAKLKVKARGGAQTEQKEKPKFDEPAEHYLASYQCPICLSPPIVAVLTPCGHIMCGACLFSTLKSQAIRERRRPSEPGKWPTKLDGKKIRNPPNITGRIIMGTCPVCRVEIDRGMGTIPGEGGVKYLECRMENPIIDFS